MKLTNMKLTGLCAAIALALASFGAYAGESHMAEALKHAESAAKADDAKAITEHAEAAVSSDPMKRSQNARPSRHGVKSFVQASGAQRTEGELCAAAGAGRTRAAEGNNRQENFSPLKSDGPHFSFREKSWLACKP